MTHSNQVRKQFLDFFRNKQHQIVPSAPVIVHNDPTLLFTNSGMNQFKEYFLGEKVVQFPRIADTQKCLRVSGKHNDLEEVGHDTYHHTLFEMLGNWSFGDYFKAEAIAWAWELLTSVYQINPDRLYVTVFGGDVGEGLAEDTEAADYWKQWIAEDRILLGNKKDNFWEMGDTGPCGPCSEIHVDIRSEEERKQTDGKQLVNTGHPKVIEIWNLVFMQFNRKADGSLVPLPNQHVDTGMGFERLCMALQGTESTYDTDVFTPLKHWLEKQCNLTYTSSEEVSIAMRVVMDHIRAICFTIADGQLPGNSGAGYVIRRILRRASRYGFRYLNQQQPFLYKMVGILAQQMGEAFPELNQQQAFIQRIIEEEEKGFLSKLEKGTGLFQQYIDKNANTKIIEGTFAFELYDTFGFPVDLTELMAKELGFSLDMEGFSHAMAEQKMRSRKAAEVKKGDWVELGIQQENIFSGYDTLTTETQIQKYRLVTGKQGETYEIVLLNTPFYPEGGGQIGDMGWLISDQEEIQIVNTRKENTLIIHQSLSLPEFPEKSFKAVVNESRRQALKANHTATHLLHAALRKFLGTHVEQRGSLVDPEYLRFDFSHFAKVTEEELSQISEWVNHQIAAGIHLKEERNVPIEEAQTRGAMMLFGEKYGDSVRIISFPQAQSVELCGGTHVQNTLEIRYFKIQSEGSVAAGIRRIEACTGSFALKQVEDQLAILEKIEVLLKNPKQVEKAVQELIESHAKTEKQLQQMQQVQLIQTRDSLISQFQNDAILAAEVEVADADSLKHLSFDLRKMTQGKLIVLGALIQGKPLLSVILSEDIEPGKPWVATELIRKLAQSIQGGGGGQPFYATAGGKRPEGLSEAIEIAQTLVNS